MKTQTQLIYLIHHTPALCSKWERLNLPARRDFLDYAQTSEDERQLKTSYESWAKLKRKQKVKIYADTENETITISAEGQTETEADDI